MFRSLRLLLEMIRFSHTLFALPFALQSAAIAWKIEPFRLVDLIGILLGMVTARSAAMAFNRIVDRRIDAQNPRTENRHLPAGSISLPMAITFTVVNSLAFLASTWLFQLREPANPWPTYLAVPVLLFLLGYSLAKRFTSLAHYWLGAALMLAPIAAWIAILGPREMTTPLLIGCSVFFWVGGFDILYACQDHDFDRRAGLHSIPARLGVKRSLRLAAASHAIMFVNLLATGFFTPQLGTVYLVGLLPVGLLLMYEHTIVREDDLSRVNQAFFQVNGVIGVGLLILVVIQLWVV